MTKKLKKKSSILIPKILVVEDTKEFDDYRTFISKMEPNNRPLISLASSLSEVDKLLKEESFDVLLLDYDFAKIKKENVTINISQFKSLPFNDTKSIFISGAEDLSSNPDQKGYEIIYKNKTSVEKVVLSLENWLRKRAEVLYEDSVREGKAIDKQKIITASEENWSKIIEGLSKNTEELYSMPSRKFEELIAELLIRDGLEVYLTPETRDGGRDILAISNTSVGKHLYFVECKRYAKTNPVDVAIVRALYGALSADLATAGLIVTTSYFTKPALQFQSLIKHRLSLKDYKNLEEWLKKSLHK